MNDLTVVQFIGVESMLCPVIRATFLAAAALLPASAAHSVFSLSQTQSLTFGTIVTATHNYTGNQSTQFTSTPLILTFNQFDTLSGRRTLTSVTFQWGPTLDASYTFINGSGNARDLNLTFSTGGTLSAGSLFSLPTAFSVNIPQILIPQQTAGTSTTSTFSRVGTPTTLNYTTPTTVNPFIGRGTIGVTNTLTSFAYNLVANAGSWPI